MNIFYQKIQEKENGRDTCCATPVVVWRPFSDRHECYEEERSDHDHVVHHVIRGADHHCLVFGSPAAHSVSTFRSNARLYLSP